MKNAAISVAPQAGAIATIATIATSSPATQGMVKRCAVYCRVSTDEGLSQAFNSIDAQKEAGHAYIASQRGDGWEAVLADYDDGGFSGGNMERPALKRLLADIEARKIDVIVVYKIDRLSRSLVDFCQMVAVFDQYQVSFVSVTQQFNTTTSMGRLMLNVLLSFAQFEREVTGERIRDKIAASKRKGMWMGGVPPLGYDIAHRQLVVNPGEAAIVQRIFKEMLTIGSPTQIAHQLTLEGITTKEWTTQAGKVRLGRRIDKKYIYYVLRNRLYLGEMPHQDQWYVGVHESIIERALWEAVHGVLANNAQTRAAATKSRGKVHALLRGLLYTPTGELMYPTYARKKGKVYHYYIAKSEGRFGVGSRQYHRLPAAEIEAVVVAQVRTMLTSPEAVTAIMAQVQHMLANTQMQIDEAQVVMSLGRLDDVWARLFPIEQCRIVQLLIERISLQDQVSGQRGLEIRWREIGWQSLIQEFLPNSIGSELLAVEDTV